jgi:hypothetical protein
MVQVQLSSLGYAAFTGLKAVAITADGLGFVRRGHGTMTQDDVNKNALEGCYAISGGKACSLIATGDTWNVSGADLATSFLYTLPAPTAINAASIPFIAPSEATAAASAYNAAAMPKAMALSLDGAYFWVTNTAGAPVANAAEAQRLALERCELNAAAIPCTIFAQDNTVVFNPVAINRAPVIDYARTTLMTNIPGMRQSDFTSVIQNDYLTKGGATSGAVYITADGHGGYAYGQGSATANDTTAKANCDARTTTAYPCFKYAVNTTLQPLTPNLVSVKTYGLDIHCKVVPRATCAAHKAVGCPAGGQYYTIQAGLVALETCN